jgi:outer membrane beta-barrel protein
MGCLVALTASAAFADDEGEELVEKVAVRNRLFSVEGRFEVGANVGFSLLSRLTEHYNFNASVAWNIKDWFALEIRGGYAFSRLTSLAEQIQGDYFANTTISTARDAADAWRMNGHGVLGLRFQPIYGKINLVAELPVHFQLYFWLGGGVGGFQRESIAICPDRAACTEYLRDADGDGNADRQGPTPFMVDTRVGPLASLAVGFRFFVTSGHSLRLEVRDWSFLDSYFIGVNRAASSPGNPTSGGMPSPDAGITNLVQIDLGYAFIF